MKPILLFLLSSLLFSAGAKAAECEIGWALYNNTLCVKIFSTDWTTLQQANDLCASQGNAASRSSVVTVKDEEMHEIVKRLTSFVYDSVWLSATYDVTTSQFRWNDGQPLTFTNWQEGFPNNNTDTSSCIKFRYAGHPISNGKWVNIPCDKRNLAICQRELPWTFEDAVAEIRRISDELQSTKSELKGTQENLEKALERLEASEQKLEAVNSRVVPVGSIYVEYFGQSSPVDLWPELRWEDVSSVYGGLFFRAAGGGSENWGSIQSECSPRISSMEYSWRPNRDGPYSWTVDVPRSGWSEYVAGGEFTNANVDNVYNEGLKVHTEHCEVRPRNQAIRI